MAKIGDRRIGTVQAKMRASPITPIAFQIGGVGVMGKRIRFGAAFGLMVLVVAGCSTVGDSLGISPPANPLSKDAKAVRESAPVPAPVPRELAMELLPTHLVESGDTLLIQPVDLDA